MASISLNSTAAFGEFARQRHMVGGEPLAANLAHSQVPVEFFFAGAPNIPSAAPEVTSEVPSLAYVTDFVATSVLRGTIGPNPPPPLVSLLAHSDSCS
jgi:hypothetical protein